MSYYFHCPAWDCSLSKLPPKTELAPGQVSVFSNLKKLRSVCGVMFLLEGVNRGLLFVCWVRGEVRGRSMFYQPSPPPLHRVQPTPQETQVPCVRSMFYKQPIPAPLHPVQPSTPSTLSTKCWVNVLSTTTTSITAPLCIQVPKVPQVPSVGSMFYHHYYLSAASATPQLTLYGLSSSLWQQCFEQQHFCGFPAKGDSAQVRCS